MECFPIQIYYQEKPVEFPCTLYICTCWRTCFIGCYIHVYMYLLKTGYVPQEAERQHYQEYTHKLDEGRISQRLWRMHLVGSNYIWKQMYVVLSQDEGTTLEVRGRLTYSFNNFSNCISNNHYIASHCCGQICI